MRMSSNSSFRRLEIKIFKFNMLNSGCALLSCSWVFIHEKAYQVIDTGIESSVMTKVKGYGYHHNRVMDVADYVFPQQVSVSEGGQSNVQWPLTSSCTAK